MVVSPEITETPPGYVQAEMTGLRQALDNQIPAKSGGNLLVATWNIQCFSSLTEKWTASQSDSPKRDLRGLLAIGEIISRFDVVAVQELKGNLKALAALMELLGDDWSFLMTDVNVGDQGNDERMAFVFNRTRVEASGLCCELVVTSEMIEAEGGFPLDDQFARTPYAASFRSALGSFVLVTLHVDFVGGTAAEKAERLPELYGIAAWMSDWAKRDNTYNTNLIALGDFNIDRADSELWWAFASTGLTVPTDLDDAPRTVYADPSKPKEKSFYDQIAWFESAPDTPQMTLPYRSAGYFDFMPLMYNGVGLSKRSMAARLSDHFPLWVEFGD